MLTLYASFCSIYGSEMWNWFIILRKIRIFYLLRKTGQNGRDAAGRSNAEEKLMNCDSSLGG